MSAQVARRRPDAPDRLTLALAPSSATVAPVRGMRDRLHLRQSLLVLLWLGLAAKRGAAMVVIERDFPELVARAEQIVIGSVTEIRDAPDTSGTPYTIDTSGTPY